MRHRASTYFLLCLFVLIFFDTPTHAKNKQEYTSLTDILKKVYLTNPTLQAAREELKETQELYPQARAGWLPNIDAEASIYATDVESSNFGRGDGATTKDATLSINQPIWRGGQTFAETARANDLISAGKAYLRQREQDIFLNATILYLDVLQDYELLDLQKNNETILKQELEAAHERKEIGEITNTDVQQTQSRLSRAKSERASAKRNYEITSAEFEEITGLKVPERMLMPYIRFDIPNTVEDMIDLAQKRNPRVHIAYYEQQAAEHNADASFRELLPQVSAFASHNRQYDPQPGIVDRSETDTIGLRATLKLYEGGAARSRASEAKSAAKRQKHLIEETKRNIAQEVRSNWASYIAAQSITENRKQEIEAAEEALKGVRIEAGAGQRTTLDILDADQTVIDAKAELARARRDENVARFSLVKSLGIFDGRALFSDTSPKSDN